MFTHSMLINLQNVIIIKIYIFQLKWSVKFCVLILMATFRRQTDFHRIFVLLEGFNSLLYLHAILIRPRTSTAMLVSRSILFSHVNNNAVCPVRRNSLGIPVVVVDDGLAHDLGPEVGEWVFFFSDGSHDLGRGRVKKK